MKNLIDKLHKERILEKEELVSLLTNFTHEDSNYLFEKSRALADELFGRNIYIRGIIEFTNYCLNNCYYCGIRKGNQKLERYRLTKEEILACCAQGYKLGFRTFVLQGGEDPWYTTEKLVDLIGLSENLTLIVPSLYL